MPRTSNKPSEIYHFIRKFIELNEYPPSVREIAEAVNLKSSSTVYGHMVQLRKRGLIDWKKETSRTIVLKKKNPLLPTTDPNEI